MSRMHAPETNHLSKHRDDGAKDGACPVCDAEMNPGKLPAHIATEHGEESE